MTILFLAIAALWVASFVHMFWIRSIDKDIERLSIDIDKIRQLVNDNGMCVTSYEDSEINCYFTAKFTCSKCGEYKEFAPPAKGDPRPKWECSNNCWKLENRYVVRRYSPTTVFDTYVTKKDFDRMKAEEKKKWPLDEEGEEE